MNGDTALILREDEAAPVLSAPELRHRVKVIQQVMRDVMKEDSHYGKIPGTPKPSLWQPGAEILCLTFGITIRVEPIEERITDEEVFYRVRAIATAASGRDLGSREAVCSTKEKKYRWRRPIHPKEWEAAPEHLRRITWDKEGNEVIQVRTDPGDLTETILQMASKRAHVALTRQVTGCSDMFAQELEEGEEPAPVSAPQRAAAPSPEGQLPLEGPGLPALFIASCKKVKSGTNTSGEPWSLYVVKTKDGKEFVTFSTSVATAAMKAQAEGYGVHIASEPGEEGRNPTITELTKA